MAKAALILVVFIGLATVATCLDTPVAPQHRKVSKINPTVTRILRLIRNGGVLEDDDILEDVDQLLQKRQQYDDYGHMRFGKRNPKDFDDYGHMRFGK